MSARLKIVKSETVFHCAGCGKTSHGPFITHGVGGPVEWSPRCRNDDCPTQWWNRTMSSPARAVMIAETELLRLQALAKKP